MATLVLSTVGTALGGPVGGAIGSLVGQSIDQQIFAGPRRGPRLGDLAVQTSSYGSPVPRVYGTMRVAGSVVWSTDLVESTQTSGAKGQPDESYSYSVSFAVALSSRPLLEVRRIWADGKLLRGAAGDFKVSTEFRFYDGSESQAIDPLIASIEGIDATPAYRGLALAVFENLELAEFGNRIPFLTFEVVADEALSLGIVLTDVSRGAIVHGAADLIGGYAATGNSIADAVAPLVQSFGVDLVDDGSRLTSPAISPALVIADDDLGSGVEGTSEPRIERAQDPARSLPASAQLVYYDADRDYQTGQSRSDIIDRSSTEEKIELPAVLTAADARSLAEQIMARRWAKRDKVVLRLPPKFMTLRPGATIEIPGLPMLWQAGRSTIEGMVSIVEFRPVWRPQVSIGAEPGRALPANDAIISDVAVALVELPGLMTGSSVNPTVYVAATAAAPAWKRLPVEVSCGGFHAGSRTAYRKSVMGYAATVLGGGDVEVVDETNSVEVELVDPNHWLANCDDDALAAGANLALVGDEVIQFATAEPIGPAKFRLTKFLRGRYASGLAMNAHATGELFLLVDPASLRALRLPPTARGQVVTASVHSAEGIVSASRLVDGRSLPGGLFVDGEQVVGSRGAAIAEPSGGGVIDSEVRSSVGQILGALRLHGLIET